MLRLLLVIVLGWLALSVVIVVVTGILYLGWRLFRTRPPPDDLEA
jgi:hypothetical protein